MVEESLNTLSPKDTHPPKVLQKCLLYIYHQSEINHESFQKGNFPKTFSSVWLEYILLTHGVTGSGQYAHSQGINLKILLFVSPASLIRVDGEHVKF